MNKILTLIAAVFVFQSASSQTNPFNERDSIQISGKVIGYLPNQADHFITFSTYDLFGKSTNLAIQIEDDGRFQIKLYQPYEGDVQLNYKEAFVNLYTEPNQVLQLEIYDSKVNEESANENAFVATGALANVNNFMFKFQTAYNQHTFNTRTDLGDKTQTDSAFAAVSVRRLNEELVFLDAFIRDNPVTDQRFIHWQRSRLQYEAGQYILFFPFSGRINKEITQKQLLKFIDAIPVNNENALNCSSYYTFLSRLVDAQVMMINNNPMYDALKTQTGKSTVMICLDEIDKFATGTARELQYLGYVLGRAESKSTPFLDRCKGVISNSFLKQQLSDPQSTRDKSFKEFEVLTRLKALKVNPILKERLILLFSKYQGTALHIDFWGDWCGPCMSELPNYPQLMTTLAGKPVKFLFLSTFTTEESMLAIKDKFKIDGDFVNLSSDEVKILNNVFEFHSYPSHFFINKRGMVIQKMSTITPSTVQRNAKAITSLLAQ